MPSDAATLSPEDVIASLIVCADHLQSDVDAVVASMEPGRYLLTDIHARYAERARAAGRAVATPLKLSHRLARHPRIVRTRDMKHRYYTITPAA